MALYEYHCDHCGHRFEKRVPMSRVKERTGCPKCKKQARKLMATFAVTGSAEEKIDLDYSMPDPREMPPTIPGAADAGHDHGHSHSHDHGADDLGI